VRGTPNQEMAADWRVLPWRGKTAAVENASGTTAARSPAWTRCVLAWPWAEVRERVAGSVVGEESNGGAGKKFDRRRGAALF
jgi:hypothetical protein